MTSTPIGIPEAPWATDDSTTFAGHLCPIQRARGDKDRKGVARELDEERRPS
jgi:hypothetical protein